MSNIFNRYPQVFIEKNKDLFENCNTFFFTFFTRNLQKLKVKNIQEIPVSLYFPFHLPLPENSGGRLREYFLLRSPPIDRSERNMLLLSSMILI